MIPPLLISCAAYLKRHRPETYRHAPREILLGHLLWYWTAGRLGVVLDNGRVVALALARCIEKIDQGKDPYAHAEQGPIVWVEEIVSTHPRGVALLFQQLKQRFGIRHTLAGQVFNRAGELRKLPYELVDRMTQGEQDHGITYITSSARCA